MNTYILNEGRTIKTAKDAVDLLNTGKLAGRIGGKKFIPSWILEDLNSFSQLVDLTLKLFDEDPSTASDEVIQFMIKASQEGEDKWVSVLENNPDTLSILSKAFASQWFNKSPEFQNQLQNLIIKSYKEEDWHDLEKDIQDVFDKRAAKKGKKITNTSNLYDTLYDDNTWKLLTPKSFEGDIELASHIKPFGPKNKYTKARWCTAAQQDYYDKYTNQNTNKLYVIQYWENGIYTEGWQLAQSSPTHIEFMDKQDRENYKPVLKNAPEDLLKKIICDNQDFQNRFLGVSLWELLNIYYTNISKKIDDIDDLFYKENINIISKALNLVDKNGFVIRDNILITYEDENVESINIPENISVIGAEAFDGFKNLKSVDFSKAENLEIIDEKVFVDCKSLQFVDLSNTKIEEIRTYTFENCDNLVEVKLPETVVKINHNAFRNCQKLSKINLSKKIKIDTRAFVDCPQVEYGETVILNNEILKNDALKNVSTSHIKIGNSVKEIDFAAFAGESQLTKIDFSDAKNLELIGDGSFRYCSSLNSLDLSNATKLTQISEGAFEACSNIENIKLPNSLTTIQRSAFQNCKKLQSLDLSNLSIRSLPEEAFKYCENLKDIKLPESLRKIGDQAFAYDKQLQNIVLPKRLLSVGRNTFLECTNLTSIKLPPRLSNLPDYLFRDCSNLKEIQISTNVNYIGRGAFDGCNNLSKIVFYGPDLEYFDPKEDIEWEEDYLSKIATNVQENKKYKNRKALRDAFNRGYRKSLEKDEECLGGEFAKMSPTKTVILQRQPYYKKLNKKQTKKYKYRKLNEDPKNLNQIQEQNIKNIVEDVERLEEGNKLKVAALLGLLLLGGLNKAEAKDAIQNNDTQTIENVKNNIKSIDATQFNNLVKQMVISAYGAEGLKDKAKMIQADLLARQNLERDGIEIEYFKDKFSEDIENQAYRVAKRKHDDTGALRRYSGEPYIVHPVGVANIAKAYGGTDDEIAASYLHDTVEDAGAKLDDIEEKFGPIVATIVGDVTNDPYEVRRLGKEEYINRELQTIPDSSLFVKLCDIYYNILDWPTQDQKDRMIRNISTLLNSERGDRLDDRCLDLIDACLEAA